MNHFLKIKILLILVVTQVLVKAQETNSPFSDKSKIDTLYYPFHEGKQFIVIDHLSQFHQIDLIYSQTMGSMPPGLNERPIANEYFIRDSKGKVIQSFNSSVNLDSLTQLLKPISFINKKYHTDDTFVHYTEKNSGFYEIFNVSIQNYNRYDTTFHIKTGMIDSLGNVIVPTQFDFVQKVKNSFLVQEKSGCGLIDNKLNVLVPLAYKSYSVYDSLIYFYGKDWIESVYNVNSNRYNELENYSIREFDYTRGFFKVVKDGKYGLLNVSTNQLLIPYNYDNIVNYYLSSDWHHFSTSFTGTMIVQKNQKFGLVTLDGKVVLDCIYDKIYRENYSVPATFKVVLNGETKEVKGKLK